MGGKDGEIEMKHRVGGKQCVIERKRVQTLVKFTERKTGWTEVDFIESKRRERECKREYKNAEISIQMERDRSKDRVSERE